jgi:hypothetical protein
MDTFRIALANLRSPPGGTEAGTVALAEDPLAPAPLAVAKPANELAIAAAPQPRSVRLRPPLFAR